MSRSRDLDPVPLLPLPAWVVALAGAPVAQAFAWRTPRATYLRANTADASFMWEITLSPLACVRVDPGRRARQPEPRFTALSHSARERVERFVERLGWVRGAPPSSGPEGALATFAGRLVAARRLADLADEDAPAVAPEDVRLFLDLVRGRWERVMPVLDDIPEHLPDWLKVALVGMHGSAAGAAARADAPAPGGPRAVLFARALALAGFDAAALRGFQVAFDTLVGHERADLSLEVAKICRHGRRMSDAVAWARRAVLHAGSDDRLLLRACSELVRLGAYDDAFAVLAERTAREPVPRAIARAHAELLLWAGRAEEADPLLERGRDEAEAVWHRLVGVRRGLAEDWDGAVAAFERAHALAPRDREVRTWLVEAELWRGHEAEALAHFEIAHAEAQTAIHTVLGSALLEPSRELAHLLEALGEPAERWHGPTAERHAEAKRVLGTFGGNRGEHPTRLAPSRGGLGISRFEAPVTDSVLSSRDAAAETLKLIVALPREEVDRRFTALAEQYPRSPHPMCYWGELDLWMGDFERAMARFQEGLARGLARWGYVGQAAVFVMTGRWGDAERVLEECSVYFPPVLGATTHVYVGEMLRRRGDLEGAIAQLTEAVRVKEGRVGAWMNLALAHHARGEVEVAERVLARVAARWPRVLWDAFSAMGEPPTWPVPPSRLVDLFEACLAMMRGNRSSHTITYFAPDGELRIARDVTRFGDVLGRHVHFVGMGLAGEVAAGVYDEGAGG